MWHKASAAEIDVVYREKLKNPRKEAVFKPSFELRVSP
jgi:hypothetical protein